MSEDYWDARRLHEWNSAPADEVSFFFSPPITQPLLWVEEGVAKMDKVRMDRGAYVTVLVMPASDDGYVFSTRKDRNSPGVSIQVFEGKVRAVVSDQAGPISTDFLPCSEVVFLQFGPTSLKLCSGEHESRREIHGIGDRTGSVLELCSEVTLVWNRILPDRERELLEDFYVSTRRNRNRPTEAPVRPGNDDLHVDASGERVSPADVGERI